MAQFLLRIGEFFNLFKNFLDFIVDTYPKIKEWLNSKKNKKSEPSVAADGSLCEKLIMLLISVVVFLGILLLVNNFGNINVIVTSYNFNVVTD